MKKTLLILALISGTTVYGGKWVNIQSSTPSPAKIELISSTVERSVVHIAFDGFSLQNVSTPLGISAVIKLSGATPILRKGAPDLPKITTSLIIPDLAEMGLEITDSRYIDYQNINVAPSKGDFTRDIDPSSVPFTYGETYQQNASFPGQLSSLREPYIYRDYRGQTLVVYPFQYNPQTKILRVYYDITLELKKISDNGINPLAGFLPGSKTNREYHQIYSKHFLNYKPSKYAPINEEGEMLIITHGPFIPAMQAFVDWKISKGMPVEVVDVSTIGNAAAIKSYIQSYYAEKNLGFVLLVGDHQQVPAFMSTNGASDNAYTYVAGTDHYNDFLIGRFSAESIEHVTTQVNKVLYYEINPDLTTNWFESCIGVASSQGPGDDNEYDYQHIRGLQTQLDGYTYNTLYELFDGSQGGLDAPGDPSSSLLAANINEGSSVIVYCGHGSQNSFSTTGFSSSNVNSLTNAGMLPFIWSVACVNGDFTGGSCFAEAWLRAKNGENLTGAVATLMSTINQSWDPPMEGQDEMVSILTESYSNNIKRTFGGISANGIAKMIDSYAGGGESMADTWVLFGDPSLVVRTALPQNITASHDPTTFLGMNQFQVSCPVDSALACITLNNEILGTALISAGTATITYPGPLTIVDTLKLVITKYNYIPYIASIPIIPASGPFVAYHSSAIVDVQGNNNGLADFGETISLNMTLKNLGVAIAPDVSTVVSSADSDVTILDNFQDFGDIDVNIPSTQLNAFTFQFSDHVTDQHTVPFQVLITDTLGHTWNSSFSITVNAPSLIIEGLTIDDISGNGNNNLDPGETADIIISTKNAGHADAPNTAGLISTLNQYITINSSSYAFNTLGTGAAVNAIFNITVSPTAPIGTSADFNYSVGSGAYQAQKTFYRVVGIVDENFETGDFTQFTWQSTGSNLPWFITTENPYEGLYCSKSGSIGHDQKSVMQLTLNVLAEDSISFFRKVSSENTYDYLYFYIDNTKQGEWSGEAEWERVAYKVTAGNHTFKWIYEKDFMATGGSDAAWVDFIVFPPVDLVTGITSIDRPIEPKLFVYPNPSNGSAFLNYTLTHHTEVQLSLVDVAGKLIRNLDYRGKKLAGDYSLSLDLEDVKPGVYVISLVTGYGTFYSKLILSR
ncbi:MAG: C25 family cysteine peptidase [Bacteroidales bacterium]